jgi:hypothetical protein
VGLFGNDGSGRGSAGLFGNDGPGWGGMPCAREPIEAKLIMAPTSAAQNVFGAPLNTPLGAAEVDLSSETKPEVVRMAKLLLLFLFFWARKQKKR